MKISERIIRIGLIALIILSFYLSYMIWLSPTARSSLQTAKHTDRVVNTTQNIRKATDIFLPLRLVWVNGEDDIKQTSSDTLITEVQDLVNKASFGTPEKKSYDSDENFLADVDIKHGVELSYFGPFLVKEYAEMFNLNLALDKLQDVYFTKVQINFDNHQIRFINMRRHQIVEVPITIDEMKISQLMTDSAEKNWLVMNEENRIVSMQYNTQEPVKLKRYSYIASNLSYTTFRDAFFTNPQDVKMNEETSNLVLYDGTENMSIQEEKQLIDFKGEIDLSGGEGDIYSQSFSYIARLGANLGNLRYFDRDKDEISYRIFVEGYPVFGDAYQGQVNLKVNNENKTDTGTLPVQILASMNAIQVPIPSDETVELPPSHTIIENLTYLGVNQSLVQSLVIAYERQDLAATNGVVDLVPMWYIRYDGQWYSYDDLVAKLQQGMGAE